MIISNVGNEENKYITFDPLPLIYYFLLFVEFPPLDSAFGCCMAGACVTGRGNDTAALFLFVVVAFGSSLAAG